MRDKNKNNITKRDINNKYRYHPVDINKYPLSLFKDNVINITNHRAKQLILFTNNKK